MCIYIRSSEWSDGSVYHLMNFLIIMGGWQSLRCNSIYRTLKYKEADKVLIPYTPSHIPTNCFIGREIGLIIIWEGGEQHISQFTGTIIIAARELWSSSGLIIKRRRFIDPHHTPRPIVCLLRSQTQESTLKYGPWRIATINYIYCPVDEEWNVYTMSYTYTNLKFNTLGDQRLNSETHCAYLLSINSILSIIRSSM